MTRCPLAVLYENSRSGDGQFTPHLLLMACVADELAGARSFRELARAMPPFPKKGVPQLLRALEDADLLLDTYERLLYVIDADRVREHAGLPRDASAATVESALAGRSGRTESVEVLLIERNLDTLVAAVSRALGGQARTTKDHLTRDRLLMRAALAPVTVRRAIRTEMPSFDRIVVRVFQLTRPRQP